MSNTEKPLPFIYQFAAGAVAGVSEVCVHTVLYCLRMLTRFAYRRSWSCTPFLTSVPTMVRLTGIFQVPIGRGQDSSVSAGSPGRVGHSNRAQ